MAVAYGTSIMYHLTQRMLQTLRKDLQAYHGMFQGDRCSGWEMEELLVRAIKSDTTAQHHVQWREGGHDPDADIMVRTNGTTYPIQVKSGKVKRIRSMNCDVLELSGYRLTRFDGNFESITDFLNNLPAPIIAIPCKKIDNNYGRVFVYRVGYIAESVLTGIKKDKWVEYGSQWRQETDKGILFSLVPRMSWQIWWKIPLQYVEFADEIEIS